MGESRTGTDVPSPLQPLRHRWLALTVASGRVRATGLKSVVRAPGSMLISALGRGALRVRRVIAARGLKVSDPLAEGISCELGHVSDYAPIGLRPLPPKLVRNAR